METSVLVVEDSETVRREIVNALKEKSMFSFYHEAVDGLQGFKALLGRKIDLVLCDVDMPRMDGFKFIGLVQSREELRDIPIILLTGKEDRESKIRGLDLGASDYITKPFDAGELLARVRVHLKMKTLQDELKQANELLLAISNTDHLTGLHNRRYLEDSLGKEFHRAQRNGCNLALLIMDIDHFKAINDTYGHQQGDSVLYKVASVFHKELRDYDIAARFGGEEFVAVIPEASLSEAVKVAERIRKSIEKITLDGEIAQAKITVSLGVSAFPAERVDSPAALISEADKALYRAKSNGRNRVETMLPPPADGKDHGEIESVLFV
jgi:two-component system cell cycle response regulator